MSVILGTAPDSWGVWFAHDPRQTPWRRFLDEVADVGYRWIELGPYGYLPTDYDTLRQELERRGLRICAGFTMFALESDEAWRSMRDETHAVCELLTQLDARYLVLIDDVYTNLFTGEPVASAELDDAQWERLVATTGKVLDLAGEHGLTVVFHPHAETHVQYEEQIERLLRDADERLGLCLDVGHHAYCGGDPVAFVRRHHSRIPYLHLKSIDRDVQARVEAEPIPFAHAVAGDMFVEPSLGAVDFPSIRDALDETAYDGFGIVEQDMYPAPFDKPLPIATRTRAYLESIDFG